MPATMQLAAVPIAGCTYVNVELVCLLTPGENVKIHEARNHYLRGDGDVRRLLSELQDICSEANADGQAIMRRILQLASQPLGYKDNDTLATTHFVLPPGFDERRPLTKARVCLTSPSLNIEFEIDVPVDDDDVRRQVKPTLFPIPPEHVATLREHPDAPFYLKWAHNPLPARPSLLAPVNLHDVSEPPPAAAPPQRKVPSAAALRRAAEAAADAAARRSSAQTTQAVTDWARPLREREMTKEEAEAHAASEGLVLKPSSYASTGLEGVCYIESSNNYRALYTDRGKTFHMGLYESKWAAALVVARRKKLAEVAAPAEAPAAAPAAAPAVAPAPAQPPVVIADAAEPSAVAEAVATPPPGGAAGKRPAPADAVAPAAKSPRSTESPARTEAMDEARADSDATACSFGSFDAYMEESSRKQAEYEARSLQARAALAIETAEAEGLELVRSDNGVSGYYNVSFNSKGTKEHCWKARRSDGHGKRVMIATCATPEEAALAVARDRRERELNAEEATFGETRSRDDVTAVFTQTLLENKLWYGGLQGNAERRHATDLERQCFEAARDDPFMYKARCNNVLEQIKTGAAWRALHDVDEHRRLGRETLRYKLLDVLECEETARTLAEKTEERVWLQTSQKTRGDYFAKIQEAAGRAGGVVEVARSAPPDPPAAAPAAAPAPARGPVLAELVGRIRAEFKLSDKLKTWQVIDHAEVELGLSADGASGTQRQRAQEIVNRL